MKVEQLMSRNVQTCSADDSANRAAQIMWEADCGFLPVVDQERHVIGIVTDRDLLMGAYTQGRCLTDMSVANAMSRDIWTCIPEQDATEVEQVMQKRQIRRVPVIDSSSVLVGVVTLGDLARASQASTLKKALGGLAITKTIARICEPREPIVKAAE